MSFWWGVETNSNRGVLIHSGTSGITASFGIKSGPFYECFYRLGIVIFKYNTTANRSGGTERSGNDFRRVKGEDYSKYPKYFDWVIRNYPKYSKSLTNTTSFYLR